MITKFMKTVLFTIIAILGFTATTVNAASIKEVTTTEVSQLGADEFYCGVSEQEIVIYMMGFGYHIVKTESITGSCNALCRTIDNKCAVVYITEGQIVGHEIIIN